MKGIFSKYFEREGIVLNSIYIKYNENDIINNELIKDDEDNSNDDNFNDNDEIEIKVKKMCETSTKKGNPMNINIFRENNVLGELWK